MTRKIRVRVTQDHINDAEQCDPYRCPIALALITTGIEEPSVGADAWRPFASYIDSERHEQPLTRAQQRFVDNFDSDRTSVHPTTFVFTIPDWTPA